MLTSLHFTSHSAVCPQHIYDHVNTTVTWIGLSSSETKPQMWLLLIIIPYLKTSAHTAGDTEELCTVRHSWKFRCLNFHLYPSNGLRFTAEKVGCSSSTVNLIIDQLHPKSQRLERIFAESKMGIFVNIAQMEDDVKRKSYISRNIKCPECWTETFVCLCHVHSDWHTHFQLAGVKWYAPVRYAALWTRDSNSAACCIHRLLFQLSIIINSGCPSFRKITQYNKTSGIHVYISQPIRKLWLKECVSVLDDRIVLKCIWKKYILRTKGKVKAIPGEALRVTGGLTLPNFKTISKWVLQGLSDPRTDQLYLLLYSFLLEPESTSGP